MFCLDNGGESYESPRSFRIVGSAVSQGPPPSVHPSPSHQDLEPDVARPRQEADVPRDSGSSASVLAAEVVRCHLATAGGTHRLLGEAELVTGVRLSGTGRIPWGG
jgi:hypothetical protein